MANPEIMNLREGRHDKTLHAQVYRIAGIEPLVRTDDSCDTVSRKPEKPNVY